MTHDQARQEGAPRSDDVASGGRPNPPDATSADLLGRLGTRSIVLVGMMGAGKTSLGRRLGARLGLPFVDADAEIEAAAKMTIPEIFAKHGEAAFRDGERRVVARLLTEGPRVIATGGGSFVNPVTRQAIAQSGLSVWLKADFDVLMRRVRKRSNRPLLHTEDPEATLRDLMTQRHPVYALADLTIESRDAPHEAVVEEVINAVGRHLRAANGRTVTVANEGEDRVNLIVPVELGARRYDIVIGRGLLGDAGSYLAALPNAEACAIVTDAHVAQAHLPALEASLDAAGLRHTSIVVAPGEASKSYETFAQVCDAVIAARLERRDLVIALGGGVIGDLAGFVAASVRRGMRIVQIPTSLLAQVDSSVGGKTGINSSLGKNLVGAFHQPTLVLADTAALDTLPLREFRAGYAEVAKYGLLGDADFFEWLEGRWREVFSGGPARTEAIAKSCAAKAAIVARDETETGERALLNLGHTFGHAYERLVHYDGSRLVHGEGVAIGMACAFRFSARLGHCSGQDAGRAEAHLRAVGLPTRIRDIPGWDAGADAILDAMHQDKKVERGRLTFVLVRGIGASFVAKNIEVADVKAFLEDELAGS